VYWRLCFRMVAHFNDEFNAALAYVSFVCRKRRECATLAKHRTAPKDRGLPVAAALIFISCVSVCFLVFILFCVRVHQAE
jgi:hypothetical protein